VAWDHFLKRCGVFAQLAADFPRPRTSTNATPLIDILKAYSLNCLVGGTRCAHCRRLQDNAAVAKITAMHQGRLCGEDAFCGQSSNVTASERMLRMFFMDSRTRGALPDSDPARW
jgi:hypothetical protein